jgi:hypothetical protein
MNAGHMTSKEFMEIAQARVVHCLALMEVKKGPEYSRGGDRFSNFRRAGQLLGVKPTTALLGFLTKHLVSVIDIVNDIEAGRPVILEQFEEKITDSINYLLLLEGLAKEMDSRESPTRRREEERLARLQYEGMQGGMAAGVSEVHREARESRAIPLGSRNFGPFDDTRKERLDK